MRDEGADREVFARDPAAEVREELEFHVAMRAREHISAGMSAGDAERAAREAFAAYDQVAAECRQIAEERNRRHRRAELGMELVHDVRFALRQLRSAPGFALAAVLTLALGIGGSAVIFGAVEAVLLRPLPYAEAGRLVVPAMELRDGTRYWGVAYGDYEDWRAEGVFESVGAYRLSPVNVAGGDASRRVEGAQVSPDFLRVLRTGAVLGAGFGPGDFEAGAPLRVLISHRLWQGGFGGAGDVVGRSVLVAGRPAEIAGVLAAEHGYPDDVDVWRPLQPTPETLADWRRRDNHIFFAIARLAPERTLEETQARLAALSAAVAAQEPATRGGVTTTAVPLESRIVGDAVSRTLWVLLAAVGLVLLIGCVNVANLLLARAAARERELGVRAALGASRARVVRQLVTESLVLATAGGAAGVVLAYAGVRLLVAGAPAGVPRIDQVSVSPAVLAFSLCVSLLCALLFGVVPALRSAQRAQAGAVVRGSARATGGVRARRAREALVAAQIALSLVLLAGAGVLVHSFLRLRATDPGFAPDRVLTFEIGLQGERYPDAAARSVTFEELQRRLEALAGVESAAVVSALPLGGGGFYLGRAFLPEGRAEPPEGEEVRAMWNVASPGFFATIGVPLLSGRDFTRADHADAPPVMIVNREFARVMFGAADPIGRRVRSWRDEDVYREIVGVVGDVHYFGPDDELRPLVYVPHAQDAWSSMVVVLRTNGAPSAVAPGVRGTLREVDAGLGITAMRTMNELLADSLARSRFTAFLVALFACTALVLTVVGLHGVLAYGVAARAREFGIRLAVGACRSDVLRMVLREASLVIAAGLAAGLLTAAVATRATQALLYGVSASDPATLAGVAVLLAAVALAVSLVAARRAASMEPARTLHE